jgi:hypothetical protein
MILDILYELIPGIRFCRIKLDDKHYINYKKNEYYIEALKIIGKNFGRSFYGDNKSTDYNLGIRYVRECTANNYNIIITKSQVKRLARPHCRKHHAMKFPIRTYEILSTVRTLIDNSQKCSFECKSNKQEYCKKIKQENILCRDYLIGSFYKCLRYQRGKYNQNSYAERLLNILDQDYQNCNP